VRRLEKWIMAAALALLGACRQNSGDAPSPAPEPISTEATVGYGTLAGEDDGTMPRASGDDYAADRTPKR